PGREWPMSTRRFWVVFVVLAAGCGIESGLRAPSAEAVRRDRLAIGCVPTPNRVCLEGNELRVAESLVQLSGIENQCVADTGAVCYGPNLDAVIGAGGPVSQGLAPATSGHKFGYE